MTSTANSGSEFSVTSDAGSGLAAPRWLLIAAVIAGLLGAWVRLNGLERKPFWHDEIFTAMVVNGFPAEQYHRFLLPNGVSTAGEIRNSLNQTPARGPVDLIRFAAKYDPQHAPLYYIALQTWSRIVGFSPAKARLFSALIGIGVMFLFFWLGSEIGGPAVGLVSFIIAALSPIHFAYAQEAREFSLWSLSLCALAGFYVRAIRSDRNSDWTAYLAAAVVSLYISALSCGVLAAQFVGAAWLDRLNRRSLVAFTVPVLLFAPWLLVIAKGHAQIQTTTAWLAHYTGSPVDYARRFITLPSYLLSGGPSAGIDSVALALLMISVSVYSIRKMAVPTRVMILTVLLSVCVPFLIADAAMGGQRAILPRYEFPLFIALQLSLAAFIATRGRWLRPALLALVALLGAGSILTYERSNSWWTKGGIASSAPFLARINNSEAPVLIGDSDQLWFIALAMLVKPETIVIEQKPDFSVPVPTGPRYTRIVITPTAWLKAWAQSQGGKKVPFNDKIYVLPNR